VYWGGEGFLCKKDNRSNDGIGVAWRWGGLHPFCLGEEEGNTDFCPTRSGCLLGGGNAFAKGRQAGRAI